MTEVFHNVKGEGKAALLQLMALLQANTCYKLSFSDN